jgi:CBS domain-containing protein
VATVYVTSPNGTFVGGISIHDIKGPDVRELGPLVVAQDVAEPNVHIVAPGDTLADCMEHFVQSESDELPVVDVNGSLVGVVSRRDVLRVYTTELLRHEYVGVTSATDGLGGPRIRLAHGLTMSRVPVPSWLAAQSLREANLRVAFNLTVVGVHDHGADEDRLPDPDEPLRAEDVLVLVGRPTDIDRFRRTTATGVQTDSNETAPRD